MTLFPPVYWLCFPLWGLATLLMAWHYSQTVKPLTERIRLIDEPVWFLVRLGLLTTAVLPILIWGHWAVGLGAILVHAVVVMRVGAIATDRRVALEALKLTEGGIPAARALPIAEDIVKQNVDTKGLPPEFRSWADEAPGAWAWLREGSKGFFSLFFPTLDPFFYGIRRDQIREYQSILEETFETIDLGNYHPRGELARIQRDNDYADSIAAAVVTKGLSPLYVQVMLTQFFFADLLFRELDAHKWAWVCQRCRPIDYFPSATLVAQKHFASHDEADRPR